MAFYQHYILDIFMVYRQNGGLGLGQGSKPRLRTPMVEITFTVSNPNTLTNVHTT